MVLEDKIKDVNNRIENQKSKLMELKIHINSNYGMSSSGINFLDEYSEMKNELKDFYEYKKQLESTQLRVQKINKIRNGEKV